jgi:hypothetical protein
VAFKIADGYVEVHGRIDDASFRRAAKEVGERAGEDTSEHFENAFGRAARRKGGGNVFSRALKRLFTVKSDVLSALLHPLETTFSIPLVAAIAASIAVHGAGAIAAALQSAVLLGVGGGVLAAGAAILLGSEKLNQKLAKDNLKRVKQSSAAELKAMRDNLRARLAHMRLAGASQDEINRVQREGQAAIADATLRNNAKIKAAGVAAATTLSDAFSTAGKRIMDSLARAAAPLLPVFIKAAGSVADIFAKLEPQFRRLFAAAAPIVPLLVDTFAVFAETILPAIIKMMPSVVEMFEVLAARAPELADAIANLLLQMAKPETIEAFGYLLTGLIGVINFLSDALGFLTRLFNTGTRRIKEFIETLKKAGPAAAFVAERLMEEFTGAIRQIRAVIGWVGRLVGAIRRIPLRRVLQFLFKPGNAIATILRITGLTRRIPRAWNTVYKFLTGSAIRAIQGLIGWLGRIPRNIVTTIRQSIIRTAAGLWPFATGGLVGAQGMQTGGLAGARQVLVGEQGPELVDLPFGSRVVPAGQTRAALGHGQGGREPVVLEIRSGGSKLDDLLVEVLSKAIRTRPGFAQVVRTA